LPEEVARGAVGVGYPIPGVGENDRHGSRLEDGVEQELALVDLVALGAQEIADLVVEPDEVAQLVVARDREAEAEVAVTVARDAIGERLEGVADRPEEVPH